MLSASPSASSSAAAAHRRPQWTSPRAPPSWRRRRCRRRCRPSVLNQGRRRVRRRVGGVRALLPPRCRWASRWRSSAAPTALPPSRCAPPPRFGCAADVATPDCCAAHHRRASPAAASTLLQSLCRCCAVHCRHSLRRRHRRSAAKLWRPFPSLVRLIVNMQAQCVGCLNFW